MDVMRLVWLGAAGFSLLIGASAGAEGPVTPEQAERFQKKVVEIVSHAERPNAGPRRTEFSGDELNAYLQITAKPLFPAGVTEPEVTLVGAGRVSGRAIVDLDAIRKKGSGGWLDPTSYLSGRLPVTATGTLRTKDGWGQFDLESATVSGVSIPKSLLQEIVSYYTKSPDLPNGVSLDQKFELTSQIKRIDIEPGKAIVFQ
jgi:hypothetical protein